MDFQAKNFRYVTTPFGTFLDRIGSGSMEYLRSLAVDNPAGKPAQFARDFPELASDFKLPPHLDYVSQHAHSSPLRISGPVIIWLHYDVNNIFRYSIEAANNLLGDGQCFVPNSRSKTHYSLSAM